jgi:hypothetical protein
MIDEAPTFADPKIFPFLGPSCYKSKIRRSSFLAFFVLRNEEKIMKAFFKIKIDFFHFI